MKTVPSLNWLRVFEAAARLESFARAADLLEISTSAVSQQVKSLESHFGQALFKRGARQVTLTDAGHAFLPAVRQALNTVDEAADSLFGSQRDRTLTLQADLILTTGWLAPRLPHFDACHPGIQLHLTGAYRDADYQRPGAELKILFGPVHRSWAQCDQLFHDEIYPVATAELAASLKRPDQLASQRLIQIPTHRINWNQVLQQAGVDSVPTRHLCFTESTQLALSMAASGYGIALARSPTTDVAVEELGLVPLQSFSALKSPEAYYLVYQNLENLSGAARNFRRWLLQQVGQPHQLPLAGGRAGV